MKNWRQIFSWNTEVILPVVGDKVKVIASVEKLNKIYILGTSAIRLEGRIGRVVDIDTETDWIEQGLDSPAGTISVAFDSDFIDDDWYFPIADWQSYLEVVGA